MITPLNNIALRAQRRRLLRHALAARAASAGTEWPEPPAPWVYATTSAAPTTAMPTTVGRR